MGCSHQFTDYQHARKHTIRLHAAREKTHVKQKYGNPESTDLKRDTLGMADTVHYLTDSTPQALCPLPQNPGVFFQAVGRTLLAPEEWTSPSPSLFLVHKSTSPKGWLGMWSKLLMESPIPRRGPGCQLVADG